MSRLSKRSLALGSAVAGFGFSGGRSSWRWFEKHSTTLVTALLIIAGSGVAGFYLRTSTQTGFFQRIFLTWLPAIGIVALSLFACLVLGGLSGTSGISRKLFIWQGIMFLLGLAVAQPVRNDQRRERLKEANRIGIHAANDQFLRDQGLRKVGGRENTMIDEMGREIVVDDVRTDAIVFRVKGRRGVRSKIALDAEGRMVSYEPAGDNNKKRMRVN